MKKRIFDICNQFAEQGIKPTLTRVRNELGGGSFSTINPLLRQWKEDRINGTYAIIDLRNQIAAINQKANILIWKATNDHCNKVKKNQQEELIGLRIKVTKAEAMISVLHSELEEVRREKERLENMLILFKAISKQSKSKLTKPWTTV